MSKMCGLFLCIAAALSAFAPLSGAQAYSQQSGGVFVGRGRVGYKAPSKDREKDRYQGRDSDSELATDDEARDEMKPMIAGRAPAAVLSLERECFEEINRQRKARGIAPLEFSEDLLAVARYYSRRMAEENFFSHTDPEGRKVRERVTEAGIKWQVLGENLAYSNGYTNPVAASMHSWMDSPGHRRNILDPDYKHTAIGVWINANGTVYFTEIFLTR